MDKNQVTPGRIVVFNPSESKLDDFKKKKNKTYPAIVTEINKDSVDLTVFGVGEIVYAFNVQHVSEAEENSSSWEWPQMKK